MTEKENVFKRLAVTVITQDVKFMGEKIKIRKLTVNQVLEIQEQAKIPMMDDPKAGLRLVVKVISMGVEDAEGMTLEDFENYPLDDLNKLSEAIMSFSGMGNQGK